MRAFPIGFGVTMLIMLAVSSAFAADKPNIVLFMADDIGLGDLSFYQRQLDADRRPTVETPNLDQLVADGMRFSDAHSPASLCAPTRFSMLTGNFSYRNYKPFGVWNPESNSGIDPDFTTIARIAKRGGYQTAFFGKWGLGSSTRSRKDGFERLAKGALHFGFDHAVELPQGIQAVPFAFYEDQAWMKLGPDSQLIDIGPQQNGYAKAYKHRKRAGLGDSNWDPAKAGTILASKAVDYIESHADAPFFLYFCSQAVHIPHAPPETFNGVTIAGSAPGPHGDMIRELDQQVAMLISVLKRKGVYEDTLFVFTSDNGGLMIDPAMRKAGHRPSNGYRGAKGSIFEGGHRVPFIAVWPNGIQPGSVCPETIVGQDMVATVAAVTGQPNAHNIQDAIDLLPLFQGKSAKQHHEFLIHQSISDGGRYALRQGDWKLVMTGEIPYKPDSLQAIGLYDLNANPAENERMNLISTDAGTARAEEMLTTFRELRASGRPTVSSL